jgi:hypothetical protein
MDPSTLAEMVAPALPELPSEAMMAIATFAGDICTCKVLLCKHHYCCPICGLSIYDGHTPSCTFVFLNAHPMATLERRADEAIAEANRTVVIHTKDKVHA